MKNLFKISNRNKFIAIMLCAVCAVFLSGCSFAPDIMNIGAEDPSSAEQNAPDENIPEQSEAELDAAEQQDEENPAPESHVNKASNAMKQTLADNRTAGKDETKADKDGEYIGDMAEFALPEGVTIDENNSTESNGAEFIYMNTLYDGTFITLTVSTLPYSELTWDDCKDMYISYLDSIDADITSEEEIEATEYPNVLINAEQTIQTIDGDDTIHINTIHIVFLADGKMCAVVGAYANPNDANTIFEMCMVIFDSFELIE